MNTNLIEHSFWETPVTVKNGALIPYLHRRVVYEVLKRMIDIIGGLTGLILSIPIILIFGLLIIIESPGPFIYSQERLGKQGKTFMMYKLRSMRIDAEEGGPQWAEKNDPRVTAVGRFIRKTRIDETPQFFNVLKGEMSLVGPRPERPEFTYWLNREIPGFINRLHIKPGLTGWAQINGGYDIEPREKLRLDLEYIQKRCLWVDLKILIRTVGVVLSGYGAR